MTDPYKTLNLLPTATPDEIKTAYAQERAKLMARGENDESIAGQLKMLDEAYATLIDPNRRAAHDRSLGIGGAGGALAIAVQPPSITLPQQSSAPVVQQPCPNCGALNPIQATRCGYCKKQLLYECPRCGQPNPLEQTVCGRCNVYIPEYIQQRLVEKVVIVKQVEDERRAADMRVRTSEAIHRVRAWLGVFFWLAVFVICAGLAILAVFLFSYANQLSR